MSLPNCSECGKTLSSKRSARKHYRKEHAGEIETPEEYLERVESEQRDFAGDEPTTEGHNPEYLTTNNPADSYMTDLREYESEDNDE